MNKSANIMMSLRPMAMAVLTASPCNGSSVFVGKAETISSPSTGLRPRPAGAGS